MKRSPSSAIGRMPNSELYLALMALLKIWFTEPAYLKGSMFW